MRARSLILAIPFIIFGSLDAQAGYKALRDFSGANPSRVWNYGFGQTGVVFTPYDTFKENCLAGGATFNGIDCWETANPGFNAIVGVTTLAEPTVFFTFVMPTNVLYMHPGDGPPGAPTDSIVRWTCPRDGTYLIKGFYEILDVRPTGTYPKIFVNQNNVTRKAFGGDDGALTGPGAHLNRKKAGQRKDFTLNRFISKGSVVSFGVNSGSDFSNDSTGFDVTIAPVIE